MGYSNKKNKLVGLGFGVISLSVIAIFGFLYLSPDFEQDEPVIDIQDEVYWNLKSNLKVNLNDESGIKYYKITYKDGKNDIVLDQKIFTSIEQNLTLDIKPPKLNLFSKIDDAKLQIEVNDNSKWDFFNGNNITKTVNIKIDKKVPVANVLGNSRYIQRGGSAVVVTQVSDENLVDKYIVFNDKKRFELLPYKKENYFIALIAWPIDIEKFHKVRLVAIDKAGNKTITKVPLYIQKKKIKNQNITITEDFIKNVSGFVLERSGEVIPSNLEDVFIYSNREFREKNLKKIFDASNKAMENEYVDDFNIKPFRRLRGSQTVAGYGERRKYYLDNRKINEAWHLGIDWASVKNATIKVSNDGEVVFKNYLGLYGNTIIINHGMGLSSLYAHTSLQKVDVADKVEAGQVIGNTGATGAVFGDHLHFGIVVQGVEVNPLEWMDKNWIKVRITNVLNKCNKIIMGK
ncbi:MAG: peptidoglycan DD-metalloendopeptidase family protein [Campylobacterota bacterium]|nr:peptidoglycan DD-metalloendopeptidase family protein [Campylobacterota bacterium]